LFTTCGRLSSAQASDGSAGEIRVLEEASVLEEAIKRLVSQLDVPHAAAIRRGGVSAFVQENATRDDSN
jgi:hypothetical protein